MLLSRFVCCSRFFLFCACCYIQALHGCLLPALYIIMYLTIVLYCIQFPSIAYRVSLYYTVHSIPYSSTPCIYTAPHLAALLCPVLHCAVLPYTVLHHTILYNTASHHDTLHHTTPHHTSLLSTGDRSVCGWRHTNRRRESQYCRWCCRAGLQR